MEKRIIRTIPCHCTLGRIPITLDLQNTRKTYRISSPTDFQCSSCGSKINYTPHAILTSVNGTDLKTIEEAIKDTTKLIQNYKEQPESGSRVTVQGDTHSRWFRNGRNVQGYECEKCTNITMLGKTKEEPGREFICPACGHENKIKKANIIYL